MKELNLLIHQLEIYFDDFEKTNLKVSQVPVGWHIDHSLIVIESIISQLIKSNPKEYKWELNWNRLFIQTINKIPRGRGKAPKKVQPTEPVTIAILKTKLQQVNAKIKEIQNLEGHSFFEHPYFGKLNLKSTIWFLELHTKHHLKIVKDILNRV
jgi:hypothetical protein